MSFRYRILGDDEHYKVEALFQQFDAFLPPPPLCRIAVAEDEHGMVKGALTLQLVPHAEPLFSVDPKVNLFALRGLIDDLFAQYPMPGYLILAETPESARLAELNGMTEVQGKLFRKVFEREEIT